MSGLVEVKTRKVEVQASIVAHLEELLERAKKGELESVVWFAEEAASRTMSWGCSGTLDQVQTIGRLEVLRHTLVAEFCAGT